MFCPQCGSTQPDELNYCKACGAHLQGVRNALEGRPTESSDIDWTKTWVAEMVMTQAEKDRRRGVTAEMKRIREIKAGVISASSGVGVSILLFTLMQAIVHGGNISPAAASILSVLWIVGVIPLLVGLALIFNGTIISKRGEKGPLADTGSSTDQLNPSSAQFLTPAETNELDRDVFSVTDETTKHLKVPR